MKYVDLIKNDKIREDIKRVTGFSNHVMEKTIDGIYSDRKFEVYCYFFENNRADYLIQYDINPLKNNMKDFMQITTG